MKIDNATYKDNGTVTTQLPHSGIKLTHGQGCAIVPALKRNWSNRDDQSWLTACDCYLASVTIIEDNGVPLVKELLWKRPGVVFLAGWLGGLVAMYFWMRAVG